LKKLIDTELIETDVSQIEERQLINADLSPTKLSQRSWGTYNIGLE